MSDLSQIAARLEVLERRRNALIHQRRKEGATLRQIADEAGLSHGGVAKILKRP